MAYAVQMQMIWTSRTKTWAHYVAAPNLYLIHLSLQWTEDSEMLIYNEKRLGFRVQSRFPKANQVDYNLGSESVLRASLRLLGSSKVFESEEGQEWAISRPAQGMHCTRLERMSSMKPHLDQGF